MTHRPNFECGGSWAAQMTRAARVAWACVLGLSIAGPAVVAQTNGPAGPAAYRCGNSYSSTPCPGGSAVNTDDSRSTAQQRESQDVTRRDAALAGQMAAERRGRERDAAAKPVSASGRRQQPVRPSVTPPNQPARRKRRRRSPRNRLPPSRRRSAAFADPAGQVAERAAAAGAALKPLCRRSAAGISTKAGRGFQPAAG